MKERPESPHFPKVTLPVELFRKMDEIVDGESLPTTYQLADDQGKPVMIKVQRLGKGHDSVPVYARFSKKGETVMVHIYEGNPELSDPLMEIPYSFLKGELKRFGAMGFIESSSTAVKNERPVQTGKETPASPMERGPLTGRARREREIIDMQHLVRDAVQHLLDPHVQDGIRFGRIRAGVFEKTRVFENISKASDTELEVAPGITLVRGRVLKDPTLITPETDLSQVPLLEQLAIRIYSKTQPLKDNEYTTHITGLEERIAAIAYEIREVMKGRETLFAKALHDAHVDRIVLELHSWRSRGGDKPYRLTIPLEKIDVVDK